VLPLSFPLTAGDVPGRNLAGHVLLAAGHGLDSIALCIFLPGGFLQNVKG
jgi:hypothetical protein